MIERHSKQVRIIAQQQTEGQADSNDACQDLGSAGDKPSTRAKGVLGQRQALLAAGVFDASTHNRLFGHGVMPPKSTMLYSVMLIHTRIGLRGSVFESRFGERFAFTKSAGDPLKRPVT